MRVLTAVRFKLVCRIFSVSKKKGEFKKVLLAVKAFGQICQHQIYFRIVNYAIIVFKKLFTRQQLIRR